MTGRSTTAGTREQIFGSVHLAEIRRRMPLRREPNQAVPRANSSWSLVAGARPGKALPDTLHELVADFPIGVEPLRAASFNDGRIRRRPILHVDAAGAGQFQRPVMRLRRQRDDEIEIEP